MNIFLTGCTGFLGSHILFQLCQQNNHYIFCIIRKKESINLFSKFPNIIERCRFIISDIDTPEKYKDVLQKCHVVIHTASPVILKKIESVEEENRQIISPAINNVKNIMDNINHDIFVRMIFTSSVAAVYNKDKTCDETCWNLENSDAYARSKVLSEVECFKYGRQGVNIVSVNSSAFFGPDIIDKKSKNNELIKKILKSPFYPISANIKMTFSDVRDVARFHVLSLDTDKIHHGRYIVCNRSIDTKTIVDECKKIAPKKVNVPIVYLNLRLLSILAQITRSQNTDFQSYVSYNPSFDNSKSKKYIEYTKMEDTFRDMLESM